MRNSFEELKKAIGEQGDKVIGVSERQHAKTQRMIQGPRPQPPGTPRTARRSSADDDMTDGPPAKRHNVFRRALRGLGGRNPKDLAHIEEMLMRLLDEVADLKAAQEPRQETTDNPRQTGNGLSSYENLRDVPLDGYTQDGYEPEGQAGTSSTGNQSGYFSNPPPSRQAAGQPGFENRHASQNRVSTVLEGDEEAEAPLEPHEQDALGYENTDDLLTPTRDVRGGSVPLATPPQVHFTPSGPASNENTPNSKSRRDKSTSSFFPKISRWSRTTASSAPTDNPASANSQRERPPSDASRAGSEPNEYDTGEHYDPRGDDRIRSDASLENDRPPSPLIPSQVSNSSEKPTYQAHRDSRNLQHPQPRAGPTARYQNHLESQVQTMSSPVSPESDQFGSNPILSRFGQGRREGGADHLSPISDDGYHGSQEAPPLPPKIRDDGPLVPSQAGSSLGRNATFAERTAPPNQSGQVCISSRQPAHDTRLT
jgi:hypothetical protein